jgi:TetR/AcrR family transcriptional regulator, transcriptional repressor of bet genes
MPEAAPERAERATRVRQRQRLIDACISALHLYGPSRTTVEKVVALADLSPGIVRFYFDSKDAMLVASLAHLAAEFEERVQVPVAQLREHPVRALERLVELYFDADIASPRKVSVWYCFWGEASSRQEYYEICGKKDDDFAALVRDLIGRLVAESPQPHLDADALALGLIGVLEVLWQTIAFQEEASVDRETARRRSMAYLRSVFPGRFAAPAEPNSANSPSQPLAHGRTEAQSPAPAAGGTQQPAEGLHGTTSTASAVRTPAERSAAGQALPAWAYADAALLARERAELLRPAWQLIGHQAEIARPGDFLARDVAGERVLVLRDPAGRLRAFRNACPRRPHALIAQARGHLAAPIHCATHGLTFGWDGRPRDADAAGALSMLQLQAHGGLIFVRAAPTRGAAGVRGANGTQGMAVAAAALPPGWVPLAVHELAVAADWKVLIEQWLDVRAAAARAKGSGRRPRRRRQSPAAHAQCTALLPNQRIERDAESVQILQVIPEAPGHCRIRCFRYAPPGRRQRNRQGRSSGGALKEQVAQAESTQLGMTLSGENPEHPAALAPELEAFRRSIRALLPR